MKVRRSESWKIMGDDACLSSAQVMALTASVQVGDSYLTKFNSTSSWFSWKHMKSRDWFWLREQGQNGMPPGPNNRQCWSRMCRVESCKKSQLTIYGSQWPITDYWAAGCKPRHNVKLRPWCKIMPTKQTRWALLRLRDWGFFFTIKTYN
jgi:hypothetical protein